MAAVVACVASLISRFPLLAVNLRASAEAKHKVGFQLSHGTKYALTHRLTHTS